MRKVEVDTAKSLRLELGLSITEICRITNTPYRTWQNWELDLCRVPGIVLFCLKMWIEKEKKIGEFKKELTVLVNKL